MIRNKGKNVKVQILVFTMMLLMALSLWGCGGNTKDSEKESVETSKETQEETTGTSEKTSKTEGDTKDNGEADGEVVKERLSTIEAPTEFYYEMVTNVADTSVTSKVWVKDGKMSSEGSNPMGGSYITIYDGTSTYVLDSQSKTGTKMTLSSEDADAAEESLGENLEGDFLTQDLDWDGMTYLGEETLNEIKTLVFEDETQGYKYWIHDEYGIPVKMEMNQGGSALTMDVSNIKVGDVSDSVFEVPTDYEIEEMNY